MISTLAESGPSSSTGNTRQFDARGNILGFNGTCDPKGRYCANLGHKQDDESGLIYMRARYCDSSAGRFISEDPERSGHNWFAYANNNPADLVDSTGRASAWGIAFIAFLIGLLIGVAWDLAFEHVLRPPNLKDFGTGVVALIFSALKMPDEVWDDGLEWLQECVQSMKNAMTDVAGESFAAEDIMACAMYTGLIAGMLISLEYDSNG